MQELRVHASSLTAMTMDAIFTDAVALVDGAGGNGGRPGDVRVVLDDVKFIDPYGLVALWGVVRYLKRRFRAVWVVPPAERDLQAYLRRMNFAEIIREAGTLETELTGRAGSTSASDVLLEMTPVEKEADVEEVTRNVLGRIRRILERELGYGERDVTAFCTVVSEACTNIFDHSEDVGVVAAQRYTQRNGTKYVIVGVADLGIGIRRSLATRFEQADGWSHVQAIVNALQKEYSRHPERGLGLFMVSRIVGDYRGSLHVRSGDARLYLRHRARGIAVGPFPGTQLAISLSARAA